MDNIFVTGGCGFVGSHVVFGLLKKGYKVTVLDSNINSSCSVIKKIKNLYSLHNKDNLCKLNFIKGDIRDEKLLQTIFEENIRNKEKINYVIHLAGLKSVKDSIINPLSYWENNVYGSISLFKTMIKYSCFNIVFSSSATVYGEPKSIPIFENSEKMPINTYGHTKLTIENIIKDLFVKYNNDFRAIILRYFNPIGAHASGLIGENINYSSDNIFPNILKVALKKNEYLKIFGNDWPTSDGTTMRDYIHVMDLADGHISALSFLKNKEPCFLTLNLGTGSKYSILELIKTFEYSNKIKIPYKYLDKRTGDTPVLLANCDLAKKILNWQAYKKLNEMCKDGWNFAKNNF